MTRSDPHSSREGCPCHDRKGARSLRKDPDSGGGIKEDPRSLEVAVNSRYRSPIGHVDQRRGPRPRSHQKTIPPIEPFGRPYYTPMRTGQATWETSRTFFLFELQRLSCRCTQPSHSVLFRRNSRTVRERESLRGSKPLIARSLLGSDPGRRHRPESRNLNFSG